MESERPEEKLYSCTSRLLHGFILVGRQGKGEANEDILPSFARISHPPLVTCEHCVRYGDKTVIPHLIVNVCSLLTIF